MHASQEVLSVPAITHPAPPPRHVLGNAAAVQGKVGPPRHSQREEHSPPWSATVCPRIHSPHRGRDDCVGDLGGVLHGCDTQAQGHARSGGWAWGWRPGAVGPETQRRGAEAEESSKEGWLPGGRWSTQFHLDPARLPTWDQCIYLGLGAPTLSQCIYLGPGTPTWEDAHTWTQCNYVGPGTPSGVVYPPATRAPTWD